MKVDSSPRLAPGFDPSATLLSLAEHYTAESARIEREFASHGDGIVAIRARTVLVDEIVLRLHQRLLSADARGPQGFCLLALGGYGRRELFPYSDVDLLFLVEREGEQDTHRDAVATLVRMLWDLRLRVGHSTRSVAECGRLYHNNLEFNIAVLDMRYLAGDLDLYGRLRADILPHFVARDGKDLVRNLAELTNQRHARYGHTIFHLEPNLKDTPGGLRDFHVCRWLLQIAELEKKGRWTPADDLWSPRDAPAAQQALQFISDTRYFLHSFYGRDDNRLSYEAQERASARGLGVKAGGHFAPAEWMRRYFREARWIQQLTAQCLEEASPARSGLYALYQDWRSRLSNGDFSVIRGRIFVRHPDAIDRDPFLLLRLFEMVARHGLALSGDAAKWVEKEVAFAPGMVWPAPGLWPRFRAILLLPHAADALREMLRLGLLDALFPEFRAIDALVIRDFYHRYTVDEHSFTAMETLHQLEVSAPASSAEEGLGPGSAWQRRFRDILAGVDRRDLLYLTILFHDVGKGMQGNDHVSSSVQALDGIMERLLLPDEDRMMVRFLTAQHLAMSATCQRRDVFDPETVRDFARLVGSEERLKMLCLLTYADIQAVNPEALTPWKAELLWQLYIATSNCLARSVDDDRLRVTGLPSESLEKILVVLGPPATAENVSSFLEGFPHRYTQTRGADRIGHHFSLARRLATEPVVLELAPRDGYFELLVITHDRPRLFASITGTLAAWGMSIIKADAFANAAGVVLDEFRFVDLHRTLVLNPSERERFVRSLSDVLEGKESLEKLLQARSMAAAATQPKVRVTSQLHFHPQSSSHSTVMELIAQDRPGLLYDVSSALAELGCNIEVALIGTEGQRAIDVFYLTRDGAKLDPATEAAVADALCSTR